MKKSNFVILAIAISLNGFSQIKTNSSLFGGKEARSIGPAVMGGRITSIDCNNTDSRFVYVGTAGGGIWKSTNAGVSFKPIFDKYCSSIGCLVVDQKNPETIWAGTGESNMRNSVSVGDGLYKSTDGGTNWKKIGLDSTEHISKIAIDPNDPNTVYVAAPGALWGDSKHRGLYKTIDGGQTWNKVMYFDTKTGCADIVIDPKNSNTLYASAWQFRRTPWSFNSGGKGSILFKSIDAGKNWVKIQNGFEAGEQGRICLAISPSESNRLYAIVESKNTGLYMSVDGGETWKKKSSSQNVTWRPFYFSEIKVDPVNPQRIYRPSISLSISTDGGESFKESSFDGGWVHSDHHTLWINPKNNSHLLLGTDGGVYKSLDNGNSWFFLNSIPVSQFYHVSVDNRDPYFVYGGLQDNGSWFSPVNSAGGVENKDWTNCGGGDGFWVQTLKGFPDLVFSESQGGEITRLNRVTNQSKQIKPYELVGEPKMRCNWNTPIGVSPNNSKTLYFGAQYLYKSLDAGDSWQRISPDLTTNDKLKQQQEKSGGLSVDNSGAENHCTIFSISESPKDENMIWVGTDDGNLQLTTDGGKTWTNTSKNITGLPANAWVSCVSAGDYDKNIAFVTFDNHAMGDLKTYVYKTMDAGKTWVSISTFDLKGFAHVIRQDLVNANLLYLGTEFGLFISIDGGLNWSQFMAGMPVTSVRDIQIHPTSGDLVMATHGRGIIVLDDLTPLRALTNDILKQEIAFLPVRNSFLGNGKFGGGFPSGGGYVGDNADESVQIVYFLKDRVSSGDVKIEILDVNNNLITTLPASKRKGINVATWGMSAKPPRVARGVKADFSGFVGPQVAEGLYKIKITKGEKIIEQTINLKYTETNGISIAEQQEGFAITMDVFKLQEELAFINEKVYSLKDSLAKIKNDDKSFQKSISDWVVKLADLNKIAAASIAGTDITGEEKIREKIGMLYFAVQSYSGKPSQSQKDRLASLTKEVKDFELKTESFFKSDLPKINQLLQQKKISPLAILNKADYDKATKK